MLALTAAPSVLVGVVLGMLGGGGAILALPILIYVAGVEPKSAIASSLFVVGTTSAIGAALHARAGTVRWRVGAELGVAAMAGAYAGGRLARFVPAPALLVGFALMMLATAAAMFRRRRAGLAVEPDAPQSRAPAHGRFLLLGAAIGVVSGLVGAGGGFLVVPALALFGGLAIEEAIATSLFVIALQSFGGLAGHVGHAHLDAAVTAVVTVAAVVGTWAGWAIGKRASPDRLRHTFAGLVLVMGLFVLGKQLADPAVRAVVPVPSLLGGAIIGAAASLFLLAHGRVAGISGLFGGILRGDTTDRPVRVAFVVGLLATGALVRLVHPQAFASAWVAPWPRALVAGLLVGFGTQLGNGCTSGHGVCGISRLSRRSIVATATFMATGVLTTLVAHHWQKGAP